MSAFVIFGAIFSSSSGWLFEQNSPKSHLPSPEIESGQVTETEFGQVTETEFGQVTETAANRFFISDYTFSINLIPFLLLLKVAFFLGNLIFGFKNLNIYFIKPTRD